MNIHIETILKGKTKMAVPVFKPFIRRKEMNAVLTCMVSEKIGPGPISKEFVHDVCDYLDVPGGYALRDPAKALSLAIESLSIEKGSNVVLPVLSPLYYLSVLKELGLNEARRRRRHRLHR